MKKNLVLLAVLLTTVGCDQGTKLGARYWLADQPPFSFWNNTVRLSYHENSGAFLSLGATWPPAWRTALFTGLVLVFLVVFSFYLWRDRTQNGYGRIAGMLIVSGGVSNLLDRLYNEGAVVDFLNVGLGSVRTGIFNVADMAIMLGTALFLWWGSRPSADPPPFSENV